MGQRLVEMREQVETTLNHRTWTPFLAAAKAEKRAEFERLRARVFSSDFWPKLSDRCALMNPMVKALRIADGGKIASSKI